MKTAQIWAASGLLHVAGAWPRRSFSLQNVAVVYNIAYVCAGVLELPIF